MPTLVKQTWTPFKPVVKTMDTAKKNTPCQAQNIKAHRLDTHRHLKQYNLAPAPAAPCVVWLAKSWPAAQLAPWSYLGAALQKADTSQRIKPQHQVSVSSSSEPSDSTDSGSSSPGSDSEESGSASEPNCSVDRHPRQHQHQHQKRQCACKSR